MSSGQRVAMAKEATTKVIDTLGWTDYATVVTFGSFATAASPRLPAMSGSNKAWLKQWVSANVHSGGGGTNFRNAFDKAFQVLRTSSSSSNCQKVILFLTDGMSSDYDLGAIQTTAESLGGVRIFSYTLGNGADQTVPKLISCQNGGVFQVRCCSAAGPRREHPGGSPRRA